MNTSLEFKEQAILINAVPKSLQEWILHKHSFIERLRQHYHVVSSIQVLQQNWQLPTDDEIDALSMESNTQALIREVLIKSQQKKWMFARTVFPKQTLTDEHECLLHLEDRSLGSILFNDPTMRRSDFELACIKQGSSWHQKIEQATNSSLGALWARRSMFHLKEKPILLTEIFLPDLDQA